MVRREAARGVTDRTPLIRLKIRWGKPRVGSSPTFGTLKAAALARYRDKQAFSRIAKPGGSWRIAMPFRRMHG